MFAVVVFLVGLVSEQISALRFEGRQVTPRATAGSSPARRRSGAAAGVRAGLLGGSAADARRAGISRARPERGARRRDSSIRPTSPRPARGSVRPRARVSGVSRGAARDRSGRQRSAPGARSRSRSSARVGVWLIAAHRPAASGARAPASPRPAIAAIYPPLVWIPAYALSETLYSRRGAGGARSCCSTQLSAEARHRATSLCGPSRNVVCGSSPARSPRQRS